MKKKGHALGVKFRNNIKSRALSQCFYNIVFSLYIMEQMPLSILHWENNIVTLKHIKHIANSSRKSYIHYLRI